MSTPKPPDQTEKPGSTADHLAVCVASLESVGRITSLHGSEAAGAAIREYASRLEALLRSGDQLIPINESKHCLLLRDLTDKNHAMLAGLKLERLFGDVFEFGGEDIGLQVRAGIACGETGQTDAEELFRAAEAAREAARNAQHTFELAEDLDLRAMQQRWRLNDEVESAIRQHQVMLYYQPQLRAADEAITGGEGLVRWQHPGGLLAPGQFLPHLDRKNIDLLTRHVIRQCVRDLANHPDLPALSINFEPYMLTDASLLHLLMDELSLWNVEPSRLTVEVTENGLLDSFEAICPEFTQMRATGVRVSMDDFGTGHSSLAQFKNLPLDELKIDRSFIAALRDDESTLYLTRMMIDLGHFFGLTVVAEGVETPETAATLNDLGCDVLQGFCYSPPLPLEEFRAWIANRAALPRH